MELLKPLETNPGLGRRGWVIRYLPKGLVFLSFLALAGMPTLTSRWLDFPVYWAAGEKALRGVTAYDVAGHFQYKYSPLVALLLGKLFRGFTYATASVVFQKSMLLLWAALFFRFAKRDFRTTLVALLFFGNALRLELELGQINALVLYLLVLLFAALDRPSSWKEDLPFAAIFSLAVQIKLFSFVVVPLLFLRREWRKLALGFAFIPFLSVGGVAVERGWDFAFAENRAWLASLNESTAELLVSEQNVAALGTFGKAFGLGVGKALWLVAGTLFAAYLWRNRARPVEWFRDRLLYAVALFNPLVWSYWILYALPLFVARPRKPEGLVALVAALFVLAAFNGQHARWAWNGGIFAGLILIGFAAREER